MKVVFRQFIDHGDKLGDEILACIRVRTFAMRQSNDVARLCDPPCRIRVRHARTFDELDNLEGFPNGTNSLENEIAAHEARNAQRNRGHRKWRD